MSSHDAEMKEVLDALANYGQHPHHCPTYLDSEEECTCGLNKILEKHGYEGVA